MIRYLKVWGMALCAVFAFGALSASAASATTDTFTSGSATGTTFLTGTQVGTNNVWGTKGSSGKIECSGATYTGSYAGANATTIEVAPAYTGCKIGAGNATVTPNGCKYVLTGNTDAYKNTSGVAEGEDATVSLNCGDSPTGLQVDGPLGCVISLGDTHPANTKVNQNLLGARYDNELESPTWDVKATFTVDNIVFTANSKCASLGFPATGTDTFNTQSITFRAYDDATHTHKVNLTVS